MDNAKTSRLGYGLGPMLWSPMSEIPQVGRNPVYIATLAVFVVLQVPTALAVNFGMLLAFRSVTLNYCRWLLLG